MAVKRGCLPWTTQYISVVYDTSKFTNDKSCSLGNATYMDHKKADGLIVRGKKNQQQFMERICMHTLAYS